MSNANDALFIDIETRVRECMHHPFLDACQIRQSVSRFHFDVACAILQASQVPQTTATEILVAVLLLQQGLSIHDEVDTPQTQKRQLSVLAGDYNSGQYYFILAKLGDSQLLAMLSEAVISVNEAKMGIQLAANRLTADEYLRLQEIIQGSLLQALAERFLGASGAWIQHIQSLVKAYVVHNEILSRPTPRHFTLRQAYDWLTDSMERVLTMPQNTLVGPLYTFMLEYLSPVRKTVESLNFAEGNH